MKLRLVLTAGYDNKACKFIHVMNGSGAQRFLSFFQCFCFFNN